LFIGLRSQLITIADAVKEKPNLVYYTDRFLISHHVQSNHNPGIMEIRQQYQRWGSSSTCIELVAIFLALITSPIKSKCKNLHR